MNSSINLYLFIGMYNGFHFLLQAFLTIIVGFYNILDQVLPVSSLFVNAKVISLWLSGEESNKSPKKAKTIITQ